MDSPVMQKLGENFYSKFGRKREKAVGNPISSNAKNRTISSTFVLFFIIFTLAWYMYLSSSSAFNSIVRIGDHMASSIFTEFLSPEAAQGLDIIITATVSPLHSVAKYLHLLSLFFIAVGIITLILKHRKMKFEREYVAFSLVAFGICIGGIALPYFASALNTSRLYQITLIFLAPFCVIGGITVFKVLSRVVRASWTDQSVRNSLKVLSVFLVIFLLCNTGFVYEVAKDQPSSFSLSPYIDSSCYDETEAIGAQWLSHFSYSSSTVSADIYGRMIVRDWFHTDQRKGLAPVIPLNIQQMQENAYIYFRSWNIEKTELAFVISAKVRNLNFEDVPELLDMISRKNKIYDNAGSQIYAPWEELK